MVLEGYLTGRRGTEAGTDWLTLEEEEALQENLDAAHEFESSLAGSSSSQPGPLSSNDPETFDPDFTPEILSEPSADQPLERRSDETIDGTSESDSSGVGIPEATILPRPADRKSLRARAWTLASRLAQRNGLSDLIRPLSGQGLGFLLSDVPDPALVDQLDEEKLAQLSMVWWHLAAAAEMTVAPVELLLPRLDDESILRRALDEQDAGLLFSSVWTLDPGHMGYRLWRRLDERDWRDLIDLMETYRGLHHLAKASGEPLWS